MTTLLAKSDPRETLLDHTKNCLDVYESLQKRMPFLAEVAENPDFFEHLFYAVVLHDFGKGAIGFQKYLSDGTPWNYRHEILSAGFVAGLQLSQEAKEAIGLTILTHHKDINTLKKTYRHYPESHPGFQTWQEKIKELESNWESLIQLQESLFDKCLWEPLTSTDQLVNGYRDFLLPYQRAKRNHQLKNHALPPLHRSYGMLMRGCMIACDHLASNVKVKNKIQTALDHLEMNLRRYVEQKAEEKGRQFHGWESFQKESGETTGQLMLSAPTGSGKTEAALLWSDKNQCKTKGNRVFYVLPYTASINAMYKRLKKLVTKEKIGVLHGKAPYFIYQYFVDKEYKRPNIDKKYQAKYQVLIDEGHEPESAKKLIVQEQAKEHVKIEKDLTKKIYRPYKVLTPFQLLKAFFGIKGFEMQMSEMSQGLFIFDEIHAYDPHTTALILTMIKKLREDYEAKFCIMTATMPQFLKDMINEAIGQPTQVEMKPEDRDKKFTRHRVKLLDGNIHDAIPKVKERLSKDQRVMVVCNTVKQAQDVFKQLQHATDNAQLLHSRFILKDRQRIEKELEQNENEPEGAELLIGTQAVEVSLDIDFHCLFTEPAPIDALIQRFGRINRKGKKGENGICDAHICKDGGENDNYIYSLEKVERTINALVSVDGVLHESKIQSLIEKVYHDGYNEEEDKQFNEAIMSVNDLVPFIEDSSGRDKFESLFKSIPVVPMSYKDTYSRHIEVKEYYEAMSYLAQIQEYQFARLIRDDLISKDEKLKQWFINVCYDATLGLIFDEPNPNIL